MQPLAALGDEARHRGVVACSLQQLDAAVAGGNHRHSHLLVLDNFFVADIESHGAIKLLRFCERLHRDAEMVDCIHRLFTISSTSVYGSRLCSAISCA